MSGMLSPYLDLEHESRRSGNRIPLSWVRSTERNPLGNLGDALSPVVTTAISGLPAVHRNFDSTTTRLVASGTIGQNQYLGTAHLWGTGIDPSRRAFGRRLSAFAAAPDTTYVIHATRGPHSRETLLDAGIHAPPIYGDPGWFIPRIIPADVEKKYDLGVVLHISEHEAPSLTALPRPDMQRYGIKRRSDITLISTWHKPNWAGFRAKIEELLACRRIVSTSFHGLVIADAYRIPCAYFSRYAGGTKRLELTPGTHGLDHRFGDFYAGGTRPFLPTYGQPQNSPTDWSAVIDAVDSLWEPTEMPREGLFLEAFPFRSRVRITDGCWTLTPEEEATVIW